MTLRQQPRTAKSFRLSEETIDLLKEWSDQSGISQAVILELLVKEANRKGRRPYLSIVDKEQE
jgi:hypothetical protein